MKRVTMADWQANRLQYKLIKQVLRSGRLTYGDKTRELEREFARIHGVKHALFTSSGTAALKIALHALKDEYGWKDGDEVIIPAVTFVATMNVVLMNNLKPVLVDVNQVTVNIDPVLIEKAITKKTRAIIPVHLLGQPAAMDRIVAIAKKHNLKVIEDSCETMYVQKVKGDIACFSTYVAHLLVTGVGGFITTNDDKLAMVMRSMMFHGRDESYLNIDDKPAEIYRRFHFPRFGYSDRATELEAAIGLGEIYDWKKMVKKRQQNAQYLITKIRGLNTYRDNIVFPVQHIPSHAFMFFPMLVNHRDEMAEYLEYCGIDTRTMMPLTTQPLAKPYLKGKYHMADFVNKHGLLIGCHQYMSKKDLDKIVRSIGEFYEMSHHR